MVVAATGCEERGGRCEHNDSPAHRREGSGSARYRPGVARRVQIAKALERIRSVAPDAGILTDFDGTLSPIVELPEAARPLDGVSELLGQLAQRYAVVAVLSGRPVAFLQEWLPPSVVLSGLYGLEVVRDGVRDDHPSGGMWR